MNIKDFNIISDTVGRIVAARKVTLPYSVEYNELYQEGILAALVAYKRFDSSRGVKLRTFLNPRIHGSIADYLRSIDTISRRDREKVRDMRANQESHAQKHCESIPLNSTSDLGKLLHVFVSYLSMNDNVDIDSPFESVIPSDYVDPQDEYVMGWDLCIVMDILESFPVRDRNIVLMICQGMRMLDIGSLYGISESMVCVINRRSINLIKKKFRNVV
jgi:RNA polymerase sigma factor for flagellar operon FliA